MKTAFALVLIVAASAYAEPIEWPMSEGGNGHFYEAIQIPPVVVWWDDIQSDTSTWSYAGQSGHLATITSNAEESWIIANIFEPIGPSRVYFLGGWCSALPDGNWNGIWEWITGETWTYENWAIGEPAQQQIDRWALSYLYEWAFSNYFKTGFNDTQPYSEWQANSWWYLVEYDGLSVVNLPSGLPVETELESWDAIKALFH